MTKLLTTATDVVGCLSDEQQDDIARTMLELAERGAKRLSSAILRTIERSSEHPRLGRFNDEGVFQRVVPRTA